MDTNPATNRSLQQHPFYFGLFANMARHNVYRILYEIALQTETGKPADSEAKMWEAGVIVCLNETHSSKENLPEKQRRVKDKLHDQFPFLNALSQTLGAENPDPKRYYHMMRSILEQLENIRNELSHAIHNTTVFNREVIKWTEFIFDDGLRVLRSRIQLEPSKTSFMERYKGMDKSTDKPKGNRDFKFEFYKNNSITEKGLAFFICLFLEPEYSNLFLKKLDGLKQSGTKEEKAVHQLYSIYSARLPHNKLQSEAHSTSAILLDILNELGRCPAELYATLSETDKKKFETKSGSITDADGEQNDESMAVMKRNQFRFPYFTLRYIDKTKMFENLRFHLDLGNYHFNSYEKNMGEMNIIRRWEKKLLTFGRLDDFIPEKRPESFKELVKDPATIDDNTPAPFIPESNPHYHFIGGNIGIRHIRVPHKNKSHKPWPELYNGKKPETEEPDFFIASDELTPLMIYSHFADMFGGPKSETLITGFSKKASDFLEAFKKKELPPIEKEKITNKRSSAFVAHLLTDKKFEEEYNKRKSWLADVLNPYGLLPHQVPETIARHLMRIEPVNTEERAFFIVDYLLKESELLLERTKRISPGSRDFNKKQDRKRQRNVHLRAGDTALFLAKDLLFLQPPLKDEQNNLLSKGKANTDEFQLLQSTIAFFGRDKEMLKDTFKLCGLIDSANPHPFLQDILKNDFAACNDCRAFYIKYLQRREDFLQSIINKKNYNDYHFLIARNTLRDDDYFISYASRVQEKPVNIPRSYFKDALVTLLKQKTGNSFSELVREENPVHNSVFLVNELFRQQQDSYQPFYNFKRNYRTVDEWYNERLGNNKPLTKKYKTPDELTQLTEIIRKNNRVKNTETGIKFYSVYGNKVLENERRIRHLRASDQVLFLMIKKLIAQADEAVRKTLESDFKLQDILPEERKSVLERTIPFTQFIKIRSGEKKITASFKIKDYGKFRKDLKDKRIAALLEYYNSEEVAKSEIEKQLKDYERARLLLIENVYRFEETAGKHPAFKDLVQEELQNSGYVAHHKILDLYMSVSSEDSKLKEQLKEIRNKMLHNQFPDKSVLNDILSSNENFIRQITEFASNWYEQAAKKLKQLL